jgi:FkbM family methyltransferase
MSEATPYRSQWGQDRFIHRHLMDFREGIFLEVGALQGETISNTFFFEKSLDWRGVLIEMQPHVFPAIQALRPRATCINCALGEEAGELLYLSAGDRSGLLRHIEHDSIMRLERAYAGREPKPDFSVQWIAVRPLMAVLDEAGISHIDYFSLDVEGAELAVLRGIDFARLTVDLFTIEDNENRWIEHRALLAPLGYTCLGALGTDAVFAHARLLERLAPERIAAATAVLRKVS